MSRMKIGKGPHQARHLQTPDGIFIFPLSGTSYYRDHLHYRYGSCFGGTDGLY